MAKKIALKTSKNNTSVQSYIANFDKKTAAEADALLKLFTKATGSKAKMWGKSIVGFGSYIYHRSNGDEGEFMATGFSMRKSGPTIYIMPGYNDYGALLAKLGPHKLGKSCLYLKRLTDVDAKILDKIIKAGIKDLKKTHAVTM